MSRLLFIGLLCIVCCPLWAQHKVQDTVAANNKALQLQEVVVRSRESGVRAKESPLQVETVSAAFLKKNPAPSLLESLQGLQGIRAQTNCQVCQTGDIRLGGMDGPYTLITLVRLPSQG